MMESAHPRHPSFGLRWEFRPGADLDCIARLETKGFSHWSLRLETFLKYGGPLADFLEARARHSQLRFFSDYLPAAPVRDWDEVHQRSSISLLERIAPHRLVCRRALPQVPPPGTVLGELSARLPLSTDLALLARDERDFEVIRRAPDMAAAVRLEDFPDSGAFERLLPYADLVVDVEIDVANERFDALGACDSVARILGESVGNSTLDVTFVLPTETSEAERAVHRAEGLRERLLREGWWARGQ